VGGPADPSSRPELGADVQICWSREAMVELDAEEST